MAELWKSERTGAFLLRSYLHCLSSDQLKVLERAAEIQKPPGCTWGKVQVVMAFLAGRTIAAFEGLYLQAGPDAVPRGDWGRVVHDL